MNEIEEFLKRAAAMRARQQQQPAVHSEAPRQSAPAPAPVTPSAGTPAWNTPARPLQSAFPDDDPILDADVIEADVLDDQRAPRGGVADYVSRHLDTGLFRERTSHLGESVKATDEAIESHLHQTFEHRLGQLGGETARAEDSTLDDDENATAQQRRQSAETPDFRALLRSPASFRNAIILSELLNPPTDRW